MKQIFTIIYFAIIVFYNSGSAQDTELLNKYDYLNATIQKNHIKSISEYSENSKDGKCLKTNARLQSKYIFDKKGNVQKIYDRYHNDSTPASLKTHKTVSGNNVLTSSTSFEPNGILKYNSDWKYIFDAHGKKTEGRATFYDTLPFTYKYKYDNNDNLIEEEIHDYMSSKAAVYTVYKFQYDSLKRLIHQSMCFFSNDSLHCGSGARRVYNNDKLTMVFSVSEKDPTDTTYLQEFFYDEKENLWLIYERQSIRKTITGLPSTIEFYFRKYIFIYDDKGNLLRKEVYYNKQEITHCYFYTYEFY